MKRAHDRARSLGASMIPRLSMLALATACSGSPQLRQVDDDMESVGSVASPIIRGAASDDSQNAVVRLVILNPANPSSAGVCTGTLLAPDLVLTARHCVSKAEESVTCLVVNGALVGGAISEDRDPQNIVVVVGTSPGADQTDAKGAKIFHDSGTNLCGHDLAVLLLDRQLSAPIAPIRLGAAPTTNERFTAVGWGTTGPSFPSVRQQRTGVTVENLGPTTIDLSTGHRVAIGDSELLAGESDCSGDSGGPALDATTGAIIAVASRSGIGAPDMANPCNDSKNVYTATAGFKDVIDTAFAASSAKIWLEGQPEPARPPAAPTSSGASGCATSPASPSDHAWLGTSALMAALAVAASRRRRVSK